MSLGCEARVLAALESLSQNCVVDQTEALETLLVYISNIIAKPREKKFRKIRVSNINFEERLGHLRGSWPLTSLLLCCES